MSWLRPCILSHSKYSLNSEIYFRETSVRWMEHFNHACTRDSEKFFISMLLEWLSSLKASLSNNCFIVRHPRIHQIPEWFLVIFFTEVRKFMDDDRVDEFWMWIRGHILKKAIAETESISRTTRTPSIFGLRDFYTFYLWKILAKRKVMHSLFDIGFQRILSGSNFWSRIGMLLSGFGVFWKSFLMFFYPEVLRANPAFYEEERK